MEEGRVAEEIINAETLCSEICTVQLVYVYMEMINVQFGH